eukprot:5239024-Prymnesium_polylepis.1
MRFLRFLKSTEFIKYSDVLTSASALVSSLPSYRAIILPGLSAFRVKRPPSQWPPILVKDA